MKSLWRQFVESLDMIKFEHTIFALPFAFIAALQSAHGIPPLEKSFWILAALVSARTAAMTFNRLVDEDLDAENPRTKDRALPAGRVSRRTAMALLGTSIVIFGFTAGMLGPLPWKLAPLALLIILGYSFCKRFTLLSHFALGLALACAPLGVWIALGNPLEPAVYVLALGVLAWTAGFDVLYALQDMTFDRQLGLHSIPAILGLRSALWVSRLSHVVALAAWAKYNHLVHAHFFPWLAWAIVSILLLREAWVMRRGELDHLDHAFFTLNSFVGPVLLLGHGVEWLVLRNLS